MVLMHDALRIVGEESQDDWIDSTANGTDADTLSSPALVSVGAASDLYVGAWVLLLGREHPNRERVVESYSPSGGTVEFTVHAFGAPIASGDRFQVWTRFRPRDVERALLLALRNMHQIRMDYLAGATINGLRQVNLSAALPWITSSNQVVAIGALAGSTPSAEEFFAGGVSVGMDSAVGVAPNVTLSIQGALPYGAGDSLVVYSLASWDDATASWGATFPVDLSSGTTNAPEEWWAWEALYRLSRQTQYRDPDLEQRAIMRLNELRPMYSPEVGYRMMQPRGPWGIGMNVGGW